MNWPEDFINQVICGDALNILKQIPNNTIQMCLTSPPYWGLRDYGVDGQFGLEPTPELYIEHMTQVFHEVKRVLRKDGTLWLNLGDTYSGSNCGSNDYRETDGRGGRIKDRWKGQSAGKTNLPAKCMCMIPERIAWSLIQDGWILRNKIIWYKPNGMPSSVRDRFSNKWEYMFLFSKNKNYYFDLESVRGKSITIPRIRNKSSEDYSNAYSKIGNPISPGYRSEQHHLGKNPGDHWTIPTAPFPEAHFAVFPEKLCERPIKSGSQEGDIVLDPFCGSGATLKVAYEMRRKYLGIDINQEYCDMADKKRLAQGVL